MSDYISRDKVAQAFEDADVDVCEDYGEHHGCEWGFSRDAVRKIVAELPAADVAPVRHGRWIDSNKRPVPWDEQNPTCPLYSAYCSECGEWLTGSGEYPAFGLYCPNCGAKMDKEDEHETD